MTEDGYKVRELKPNHSIATIVYTDKNPAAIRQKVIDSMERQLVMYLIREKEYVSNNYLSNLKEGVAAYRDALAKNDIEFSNHPCYKMFDSHLSRIEDKFKKQEIEIKGIDLEKRIISYKEGLTRA